LIAGSGNSFIATLVERHTRFVMLAKVGNKDSHSVVQALIKQAHKLPKELYRCLLLRPAQSVATQHQWKCQPPAASVLSKSTDLSIYSQSKLSAVARQLNERPRKALQYQTSAEKFAQCVASIR